jgi:CRP-like cAMP-binding protein
MPQRTFFDPALLDFAGSAPLFQGIPDKEKALILREGKFFSYARKDTLFKQDDPITRLYIVCSGAIRIFYQKPGAREIITSVRVAKDSICASGMFDGIGIHRCHGEAIEDSLTLEFSSAWLDKNLSHHPVFLRNVLQELTQRIRLRELEMEQRATLSMEKVLECYLRRTCAFRGYDPRGFELPYSKSLLAGRLGIKQETISRILPRLKNLGITISGKHVAIDDTKNVEPSACEGCSFIKRCPAGQAREKNLSQMDKACSLGAPLAQAS